MKKASPIEGDWLNEPQTSPRAFPLQKPPGQVPLGKLEAIAAARALSDDQLSRLALYQETLHSLMAKAKAEWEARAKPNMADPRQRMEAELQFKNAQTEAFSKSGLD